MAWKHYGTKYNSKKLEVDGIKFDSKKEANRYQELRLLEREGLIRNLQRQMKFTLLPAQKEEDTKGPKGGVIKGKVIERECSYIADFVYQLPDSGKVVVEDTKGFRTPEYRIKKKMMLYFYGIRIKEV